jgi:adenylate cyclase
VLASSSALYFADPAEQRCWETGGEVRLRGRRRKTQLAWPDPDIPVDLKTAALATAETVPIDVGSHREVHDTL